jgi:hypothetical protein
VSEFDFSLVLGLEPDQWISLHYGDSLIPLDLSIFIIVMPSSSSSQPNSSFFLYIFFSSVGSFFICGSYSIHIKESSAKNDFTSIKKN